MEGFSDGVFGFAITLLVIDIAIHPPGTPLQQVLHAWPSYLAYVISFMTIGTAWLVHTAMTDQLAEVDPIFLRLNLLVLIVVVFLPFPTQLVADSLHDPSSQRVFVTIYGLTLLGNPPRRVHPGLVCAQRAAPARPHNRPLRKR